MTLLNIAWVETNNSFIHTKIDFSSYGSDYWTTFSVNLFCSQSSQTNQSGQFRFNTNAYQANVSGFLDLNKFRIKQLILVFSDRQSIKESWIIKIKTRKVRCISSYYYQLWLKANSPTLTYTRWYIQV